MGDDQVLTKKQDTFPALVRQGLERSSLSLRELCRRAGTDPSFMSKVIRGKLPPPSDEKLLKRLAKALGQDALTLIISTGMIPSEMRSDPESIKRLLERGDTSAFRTALPPRRPASRPQAVHIIRSPQLSEDLL